MHGGLGDGDADADVPGAVRVGGREAVVVDYEAADGDACCAGWGLVRGWVWGWGWECGTEYSGRDQRMG